MPDDDLPASPFGALRSNVTSMRKSSLRHAIDDVDHVIEALLRAREQVSQDPSRSGITMMELQNPIKGHCDSMTDDLKRVTKAQKAFAKTLDKALPVKDIPMDTDPMTDHTEMINRAIGMHFLREGQFPVAATFHRECKDTSAHDWITSTEPSIPRATSHFDEDGDDDMCPDEGGVDTEVPPQGLDRQGQNDLFPQNLHAKFEHMYGILNDLKHRNLQSAIDWARDSSQALESRGSNLEFELCKLQYVWLFKGPSVNGLPDDENNGQMGALRYARTHLVRFQARHPKEIQQLCCVMVYAPNIAASPYHHIFQIDSAFEDISLSFTREFCSLLGLSAESPLYIVATAGAIALPRLMKYTAYMKEKRTEWTTENELAFETPLPASMIYHPIFVCPVSKEQTTEENPPMLIPCGHVISRESLNKIAKGPRFKCPYCPEESFLKDARKISF